MSHRAPVCSSRVLDSNREETGSHAPNILRDNCGLPGFQIKKDADELCAHGNVISRHIPQPVMKSGRLLPDFDDGGFKRDYVASLKLMMKFGFRPYACE